MIRSSLLPAAALAVAGLVGLCAPARANEADLAMYGKALDWIAGLLSVTVEGALALASEAQRDPRSIVFLPYLAGERARQAHVSRQLALQCVTADGETRRDAHTERGQFAMRRGLQLTGNTASGPVGTNRCQAVSWPWLVRTVATTPRWS